MTQSPYPQPARPYAPPPRPPTNGLGLAGFIVSIVGMVVCLGALCPIGALMSLPAAFKPPRGFAVAGLIIGVLGTLLWGLLWVLFVIYSSTLSASSNLWNAEMEIDGYYYSNNALPDDATGNQLVGIYDDQWGTPLSYRRIDAQNYELISAGPDQQLGTADDQARTYTPYNASAYAGGPAMGVVTTEQVIDQAHREIEQAYKGEYNCPDWLRVETFMGTRFVDEWGNTLRYNEGSGKDYELLSAGPDGQLNTVDDISRHYTLGAEVAGADSESQTDAEFDSGNVPGPLPADGG
ncbi:MAG: hypothetical protein AAGA29_02070 [Planctomycetota bacterium]